MTPAFSDAELEGLRLVCDTDDERALLERMADIGQRAAVAERGEPHYAASGFVRTLRRRARKRGFAPEHGWDNKPVPKGFQVDAVSDRIDADGNRTAAWLKSKRATSAAAQRAATPPPDHLVKRTATLTDAQGKVRAHWTSTEQRKADEWESFRAAVAKLIEPMPGAAPVPPPARDWSETVTVYGLGDPHHGMLAWAKETGASFDLAISREITTRVIGELLARAPDSRTGVLVLIGDNFHADDDRQVTPGHGHKLDVDGRSQKVFSSGVDLWVAQIDAMLAKHERVLVRVVCGNHDPQTSFYLAEVLRRHYRLDERVHIGDNAREHQYDLFGKVLLGYTHGHRTKPEGLQGVMSTDVPHLWAAASVERHWFTGHIHSKTFWELHGCTLESLRTLAAPDAYAARSGYRSKRAAVAVTYDPEEGEIARATVGVRA